MDDPGVMVLFSGTDILGVTPEQIGTSTGMLGDSRVWDQLCSWEWWMKPIRRPLRSCFQLSGLSHGTDVWLGNAQDLIKAGIAGSVNRYRMSG